ncbi:MAG: tRNA 2-thiouridine(34) synthase MnmA [Propionibacteriaceae bacterium]|jgi:tRNA-specific 2-thiouridylase|nr:tRNA 2-thiouridine(34) synthase MnmA [Propionibacteriaceae bacterium]
MARLVAALSGGVDSAVAAARLRDAGHDVTAIHLALSRNPATYRSGARGCCSLEDANDARRVADVLGLPFYVWDLSEQFHRDVVTDFLAEYTAGRTPNPCLRCNEKIKFAAVLDRALALGFDGVVTGHYARLRPGPELHRALDPAKDQSYVLAGLTRAQLERSHFPLGESLKADVRAEAAERGLRVAGKPDSVDICFIPDGDTPGWLHDKLGFRPGVIEDEAGDVVGRHQGTFTFTVGQRRGLHLGRPAADGRPRYVLRVDPALGKVTVGPREHLKVRRIAAVRPVWTGGTAPAVALDVTVQFRAHGEPLPARLTPGDSVTVELAEPAFGVAPGQMIAFYVGTQVVGSGTIDRTE